MEPVTHFLTGACLARAGFNRKAAYATLAMTLAAEAPDLDVVWSAGGPVAGFQHHRGITHTFLGLPFEAALVVGVVWGIHRWRVRKRERAEREAARTPRPGATAQSPPTDEPLIKPLTAAPVRWGLLYCFTLIALLSHLLLDWTNNYGLRPFYPFDTHWYAGSFVFIVEPVMLAALFVGLCAPAFLGLIAGEVGARRTAFRGRGWAIAVLAVVIAMWGVRWWEHDAAVEAASAANYGPGPASVTQTSADQDSEPPPRNAESSIPAEVLRVTADPYPGNPFLWQTVVETPSYYQVATVDLWKGTVATDPERDLFYKPEWTPAVRAARKSWLGRVYLDWSSWPVVADTGPTAPVDEDPRLPDWHAVTFRDLRFQYDTGLLSGRKELPLSGVVYVDSQGNIERMELDGHVQR
ncbi:MAG TPA: metal-dependent hydrolase [Acidobacteriaceae bacterium]|nr:metal-dependent hydrolase [Acidobacteriaceae bacterium]